MEQLQPTCKIENSVPLPIEKIKKYPFEEMEQGQSFTVIPDKRASVYNSAKQFAKKNQLNWIFITRREGELIRIWRIK